LTELIFQLLTVLDEMQIVNRKGYASIQLQLIVDDNLIINNS